MRTARARQRASGPDPFTVRRPVRGLPSFYGDRDGGKAPMSHDPTYIVEIAFTAHPHTEHLQDEQAIRDEARSWFGSLGATVHAVTVRAADAHKGRQ